MDITILITPLASAHIIKMLTDDSTSVRIKLKPNGCAGWTHEFSLCDEPEPLDHLIVASEVRFIVDNATASYINGSTVDYVKCGINYELIVTNDKMNLCGCGKSFTKK